MSSVESFILGLGENEQKVAAFIHHLITDEFDLVCDIKFGIPMYARRTWVCYLNPIKKGGLELAFTRGNELSNEQGILNAKGRKYVSGITLFTIDELPEKAIHEILQEAVLLDEVSKSSLFQKNS